MRDVAPIQMALSAGAAQMSVPGTERQRAQAVIGAFLGRLCEMGRERGADVGLLEDAAEFLKECK